MKLRDIQRGTRAFRTETLPLLDGTEVTLDVRVLDGAEQSEAREYAVAEALRTKTTPQPGEVIFDEALSVCTILLATYESGPEPIERRARFFSSAKEVRQHLDADRIALLAIAQEAVQMSAAARVVQMEEGKFMDSVIACAAQELGTELPFERWARGLQRTWVHTLACRHVALLAANLRSGSDSETKLSDSIPN